MVAILPMRSPLFDPTISADQVVTAMYDAAVALADDLDRDAGRVPDSLDDAAVIAAMRLPVSFAAVCADVCARLGIPLPAPVRHALDG